jgi:hypothetical protein
MLGCHTPHPVSTADGSNTELRSLCVCVGVEDRHFGNVIRLLHANSVNTQRGQQPTTNTTMNVALGMFRPARGQAKLAAVTARFLCAGTSPIDTLPYANRWHSWSFYNTGTSTHWNRSSFTLPCKIVCHQVRWSSKKRQRQLKKPGIDAFAVLGVTRSHKYVAVKSAFLQIAMKHHPDTVTADTEDERESSKEIFVAARKAFEAIVAGPDGLAILKSETADYVEEDLDQWFKSETGYDMPFMDAATMKEVAEMTESVGGGLDRDGGMWTLAMSGGGYRRICGDGRSLLQLEAGVARDRSIDGILRRKRRQ